MARGFVYDTTSRANPGNTAPQNSNYANYIESGIMSNGTFSENLTLLSQNTTYYYRAYGTAKDGSYLYSDEVSFTTVDQKTITKDGNARILISDSFTKEANSRIEITDSENVYDGTARIKVTSEITKDGTSRILISDSITKDSNARIKLISDLIKDGTAAIKASQSIEKIGNAYIELATNTIEKDGTARIKIIEQITKTGTAKVIFEKELTKDSNARIKLISELAKDSDARIKIINSVQKDASAKLLIKANASGSTTDAFFDTLTAFLPTPEMDSPVFFEIDSFTTNIFIGSENALYTEIFISSFNTNIVMDKVFKQDDTATPLDATLKDNNGVVDLTNATDVKLYMKARDGSLKIDGKNMSFEDRANGEVKYQWETEDVDTAGVFQLEIVVFWGTKRQTFPNSGYMTLTIAERIE